AGHERRRPAAPGPRGVGRHGAGPAHRPGRPADGDHGGQRGRRLPLPQQARRARGAPRRAPRGRRAVPAPPGRAPAPPRDPPPDTRTPPPPLSPRATPAGLGRATRRKGRGGRGAPRLEVQDRWQMEVAAMLSQIGCVTLPPGVAEKVYHGAPLTPDERATVDG